jgi:hypothetical protein
LKALLHDLVLPRTDAGVAVQAGVVLVVLAVTLRRTWTNPDLRIFTMGVGVFVFGLMMLRASH